MESQVDQVILVYNAKYLQRTSAHPGKKNAVGRMLLAVTECNCCVGRVLCDCPSDLCFVKAIQQVAFRIFWLSVTCLGKQSRAELSVWPWFVWAYNRKLECSCTLVTQFCLLCANPIGFWPEGTCVRSKKVKYGYQTHNFHSFPWIVGLTQRRRETNFSQ